MMHALKASLPVDHVAIAVPSIEESRGLFELLTGAVCSPPLRLEEQGVRVSFAGMLELLEPLGPDTPVGRFLARRGSALHHIAYRTENIEAELERLLGLGMRLIDERPRPGAHGLVAFVHPSSMGGILVEIVQRSG